MTFFEAMNLIVNTASGSFKVRRKRWNPSIYVSKVIIDGVGKICEHDSVLNIDKGFCAYSEDIMSDDWEEYK